MHASSNYRAYTIERYVRTVAETEIWETIQFEKATSEVAIPADFYSPNNWINTQLNVASYEAAIAYIALLKVRDYPESLRPYRLRLWEVSYSISATDTEKTALYPSNKQSEFC
jgi:hypothetical protein